MLLNATAASSANRPARFIACAIAFTALVYALLAGLHTVEDFDLGWQLATGRWIVQHHRIFSSDVFSYTASGQPWIYPALSGLLFYLTFLAGGYALLSWLGALASAATVGILALRIRRMDPATAALALIAVPLIANRTQPRAEMFTAILFAGFLALLWNAHGETDNLRTSRLTWQVPLLMVLWVNLHPGFVAGLALCVAYALVEAIDLLFPSRRAIALNRLRATARWLPLTALATLCNPFGWKIYSALLSQSQAQALHDAWIVEWSGVQLSSASWHQALDCRDPQSSFWWLLAAAIVGFCVALYRKEIGGALLLAGATYAAMQHVRLQALFACVVVVVAGDALAPLFANRSQPAHHQKSQIKLALAVALAGLLVPLAIFRSSDLISNRYYMNAAVRSEFGAGLSWWFPERALDFVEREHLPANVFNGYALGGYMTWRLFPGYRDYIDSRALPFGSELFFRAYDLSVEPPDSPAWQQEAATRQINTILVPLSRYQGMTLFPQLEAFCKSSIWRPVYLDEVSAVFVRVTPDTEALTQRLAVDCTKTNFVGPVASADSLHGRSKLFNFYANASGVLYGLGRYGEALTNLDRAQAIADDNASLHLLRALALQETGKAAEAEEEFRTSLSLDPTDEGWFDLGLFYLTQKRYSDAADIFRKSAEISTRPHELWMTLGLTELELQQPEPALQAFDKAEASNPFGDAGAEFGAGFHSLIATGRSKAWYQLGDVARAVSFQEEAVRLSPNDAKLWSGLADLYDVQGRTTKAAEARSHVKPAP